MIQHTHSRQLQLVYPILTSVIRVNRGRAWVRVIVMPEIVVDESGSGVIGGVEVRLEVTNTRVWIHTSDRAVLDVIDAETCYRSRDDVQVARGEAPRSSIDEPRYTWDGYHHLLHLPKTMPPWVPTGLLERVQNSLVQMGRTVVLDDKRLRPVFDDIPSLTPVPADRPHQKVAVSAALKRGQGVVVAPPRSGKTRILLEICRQISLPVLWVAPTSDIVAQTAAAAKEFFLDCDVMIAKGKPKPEWTDALFLIGTPSKIPSIPEEVTSKRLVLVCDEAHHFLRDRAWGRWITACTDHVYWRFAASGSYTRSISDEVIALEAMFGPVLSEVSSAELVGQGYLVPTEMAFVPVKGPVVHGASTDYHGEGGFGARGIHTHDTRQALVAWAAQLLVEMGRTVVVLVGIIKQGEQLADLIRQRLPPAPEMAEFKAVEFLSRKRDVRLRRKILDAFCARQEVKVVIGTSVLGEGVDIPNADALIYARGEKAAVTLRQGWYRVGTATPEKEFAIVLDFADQHHKKLLRHSVDRLRVAYAEETFAVSVLDEAAHLSEWLASLPTNKKGSRRDDQCVG